MTREEKQLLLQDICGRLPYGVMVQESKKQNDKFSESHDYKIIGITCNRLVTSTTFTENTRERGIVTHHVKLHITDFFPYEHRQMIFPYLRPISSMTLWEKREISKLHISISIDTNEVKLFDLIALDWLNSHYFDYRGLIKKGLAIEAPEGMYNIKIQGHE